MWAPAASGEGALIMVHHRSTLIGEAEEPIAEQVFAGIHSAGTGTLDVRGAEPWEARSRRPAARCPDPNSSGSKAPRRVRLLSRNELGYAHARWSYAHADR